jgi:hypothetical protein
VVQVSIPSPPRRPIATADEAVRDKSEKTVSECAGDVGAAKGLNRTFFSGARPKRASTWRGAGQDHTLSPGLGRAPEIE